MVTLTKPVISCVRAPPPEEPIYRERTVTLAVPLETAPKSSAKPAITVPTTTVGGGDSGHPFTLKNLEAPENFLGLNIQLCDHMVDLAVMLDPPEQGS